MNTTPATAAAAPRSEPAASSAAPSGDAVASAFEILFGTGLALPSVAAQGEKPVPMTEDDLPPELTLADLSGWMQQLPMSPPQAAPGGMPPSLPAPALPLAANPAAAADAQAAQPAPGLLSMDAGEAMGLKLASNRPLTPAPGALAAAPPSLLGEVVTKALMRRTEVLGARELATPAAPSLPTAATPDAPSDASLEVVLPPGSAPKIDRAFSEGMAVRLQWMAQQQVGRAEIQLHPEDLGSIDVQIEFDGKSVRADFQSPHGEVRQLLESSLPRLRELLESQGLQLQHADVGSGQGRGERRGDAAPLHAGSASADGGSAETPAAATPPQRRHDGQLSEYA